MKLGFKMWLFFAHIQDMSHVDFIFLYIYTIIVLFFFYFPV